MDAGPPRQAPTAFVERAPACGCWACWCSPHWDGGRSSSSWSTTSRRMQFVPLVLIRDWASWLLGSVTTPAATPRGLRALQIVMGLFVLSGFAGMLAHFQRLDGVSSSSSSGHEHVGAVGRRSCHAKAPLCRPRG